MTLSAKMDHTRNESAAEPALTRGSGDQVSAVAPDEVFYIRATPGQIRFWWVDQLHPNTSTLNMALAWKVSGPLDPARVADTFAALIDRHEALRTTFEYSDGALWQVIHPTMQVEVSVDDLSRFVADERERETERRIYQEALIGMDMSRGPLLATRILRLSPEEHILLVTLHRSIADGWSNGILIRDFAAIYNSLETSKPAELPEIPLQFGDYAHWLDEWRKGPGFEDSLKYWRETLRGNFTPLGFPHDCAEGESANEGRIESLLVPFALAEQVRQFCQARQLTPHMLYLSVFALTASRLTGQADIVIGTPCANRRPGTEEVIGSFSNPQTVRFTLDAETTLAEVLESARASALSAMKHQELPFEDLCEDDFFSRDENQIPLQLYFIYQKAFMQAQQTPSLRIAPLRSVSPGAAFELSLSIVERTEGPRLQLEYDTGKYRVETIRRILHLYIEILTRAVEQPEAAIATLPAFPGLQIAPAEPAFRAKESGPTKLGQGFVGPRDALELQVMRIWESVLGIAPISIHDSFFDLGGRSLAAMQIISRINRAYVLDFGLATLISGNTIERLTQLIRDRLPVNTATTLIPMQPEGSGKPLFILHGAGGNIIRFYQLAALVGKAQPIYGVQAQSLLAHRPALLRLEDQAAHYLKEIREVQPKGPYSFLGYSFGGFLALEIAHQLRAQGEEVELLGMLDSRERQYLDVMTKHDSMRAQVDRRVSRFLSNFLHLSLRDKLAYLRGKTYTRMLRHYYRVLHRLGVRTVPSFLKSTDEISFAAAVNYVPRPWPGRITLFRASIQPDPRLPQDLGWSPYAAGGMEVIELPGDHDLVFQEPNIQVLAQKLRERLERASRVDAPVSNSLRGLTR